MTQVNGKGNVSDIRGGVVLGGRSMTLTLSRPDYERLTVIAQMNNVGQTQMLESMVSQSIDIGWSQLLVGKLVLDVVVLRDAMGIVLANWITWARF